MSYFPLRRAKVPCRLVVGCQVRFVDYQYHYWMSMALLLNVNPTVVECLNIQWMSKRSLMNSKSVIRCQSRFVLNIIIIIVNTVVVECQSSCWMSTKSLLNAKAVIECQQSRCWMPKQLLNVNTVLVECQRSYWMSTKSLLNVKAVIECQHSRCWMSKQLLYVNNTVFVEWKVWRY
jgi:hypothetical protein